VRLVTAIDGKDRSKGRFGKRHRETLGGESSPDRNKSTKAERCWGKRDGRVLGEYVGQNTSFMFRRGFASAKDEKRSGGLVEDAWE